MANGTANTLRQGRTELVPINPLTMADGTANELRRPPKEERPRPRRGRFVVDGRPYYHYVLPRRAGAAPYDRADAETAEPTRRRRLGRAPSGIPGEAGTGGRLSRAAEGGESEIAPRVRPPIPAEEAGTDAALPPDECAEVRITTSGGIQWRQRVALQSYGASSPDDVAVRLQKTIARGDPVTLSGPDGSFTVRAGLVQNLIVGPCRGF